MQRDLPFILTGWIADRVTIMFEHIKKLYSKPSGRSHQQSIGPLKYGRNQQALDNATKKIMQEKIRNLKSNPK